MRSAREEQMEPDNLQFGAFTNEEKSREYMRRLANILHYEFVYGCRVSEDEYELTPDSQVSKTDWEGCYYREYHNCIEVGTNEERGLW